MSNVFSDLNRLTRKYGGPSAHPFTRFARVYHCRRMEKLACLFFGAGNLV